MEKHIAYWEGFLLLIIWGILEIWVNVIQTQFDLLRKRQKLPKTPPHIHRRINTNVLWNLSWYFSVEWNRVCFYNPLNISPFSNLPILPSIGELGWKCLPCSFNVIFLEVPVLASVVMVGVGILASPKWSSCTGSGLISSSAWCYKTGLMVCFYLCSLRNHQL